MKQPTFIQSLIEKYTAKQNDKPRYTIKNLYCGNMERLYSVMSPLFNGDIYVTTRIKDFAIFYKKHNGTYVHIKTGMCLPSIQEAEIGELVVNDYENPEVKPLIEFFKQHNIKTITPETKISKSYITNLEDNFNNKQQNNILNK